METEANLQQINYLSLHCLGRRDAKESTCLLRHITTEKSGFRDQARGRLGRNSRPGG